MKILSQFLKILFSFCTNQLNYKFIFYWGMPSWLQEICQISYKNNNKSIGIIIILISVYHLIS